MQRGVQRGLCIAPPIAPLADQSDGTVHPLRPLHPLQAGSLRELHTRLTPHASPAPSLASQTIFAGTADFELLLEQRSGGTPIDELKGEGAREGARATRQGWVAVVHDPHGRGALVPGEPLPLMLTALRCNRPAAAVTHAVEPCHTRALSLHAGTMGKHGLDCASHWHRRHVGAFDPRRPLPLALALASCQLRLQL